MRDSPLDVTAIGNAIVDVISREAEALLARLGIAKGVMTLVDGARAAEIYDAMGPALEISGGSAANTIVGLTRFGGTGAFIGKVRDDAFGRIFSHDIRAAGAEFRTPPSTSGPDTATSLVLVTPDAERSMNTHLGACLGLGVEDLDETLIRRSGIVYLEGYLCHPPSAYATLLAAAQMARACGARVALSLSDPFCVENHRPAFLDLVANHSDILFANEEEIMALYEATDFDTALTRARDHSGCALLALTRGGRGSVVVAGETVHMIDAAPVAEVVDTTGAGDLYAAGLLYGLAHGADPARAGQLASIAAAEIIGHIGARPQADLAALTSAKAGAKNVLI